MQYQLHYYAQGQGNNVSLESLRSWTNTRQLCVCVGLNHFSCDLRNLCLCFLDFVPSIGHRVYELFSEWWKSAPGCWVRGPSAVHAQSGQIQGRVEWLVLWDSLEDRASWTWWELLKAVKHEFITSNTCSLCPRRCDLDLVSFWTGYRALPLMYRGAPPSPPPSVLCLCENVRF